MKICIVTPTLTHHDAIGNDVRHQCAILSKIYDTSIYAENYIEDDFKSFMIKKKELFSLVEIKDNIIIYHHAVLWHEGQDLLESAKCKIYLKYHNITRPSFFKPYNEFYTSMCDLGRQQTEKIIKLNKVTKFLSDSKFNAQDLLELGVNSNEIDIVAPFHKLDDFKNVNTNVKLANELLDGRVNILFVGRFVPNKGHKHLVKIIAKYINMYDRNIQLNIVGGLDEGLSLYISEIKHMISSYDLNDIIHIKNKISFEELHTYFNYSHIFLLMSEHEGFCVPILEAQMHNLPIIAINTTAISETIGEEQLVFTEINYSEFAASIHVLLNNNTYRNYLVEHGQKNLSRFSNKIIEKKFMDALNLI